MPKVVMPRIDPGMQTGKIVEWLKKEGDQVQKGEAVLVVEGEKTTFEIEAPASGVLTKILFDVGTDVPVTQAVAMIGEPGDISNETTQAKTVQSTQQTHSTMPVSSSTVAQTERVLASPAARHLAQEHGVDLSRLTGSGPGGRITREDVLAAVQVPAAHAAAKPRQAGVQERIRLEGTRKTVAERLSFSARTSVPVTLTMEADASNLMKIKNQSNHVSFTAFAVKAAAKALEEHPMMNSTIEGYEIITYSDINVAVAVNTDEGLVAPVIFNANKKNLKEITAEIDDLQQKAKENRLSIENLTGGTFTVTNLGGYDIEYFAPVINPPQCAALGLGRIAYKPFAVGERVTARPAIMLSLVFDHRIVDGVPAAKFLQDLKRNLEDAESLL